MKKRLLLITTLFVVLVLVLFVSQQKSTLTVTVSEKSSNVRVLVNDTDVDPSGAGGVRYEAKVRPGKVKVVVDSGDYERVEVEESIGFMANKEISVTLKKKDAQGLASDFIKNVKGTVSKEKVFDENWLVFLLAPESSNADTIVVVAKRSSVGEWQIVEEGTSVDLSPSLNPPDEVLNYIDSL